MTQKNRFRSGLAILGLPLAVLFSGACSSPFAEEETKDVPHLHDVLQIEKLADGNMESSLDDLESGLYKVVIPAEYSGTSNNLPCIFHSKGKSYMGGMAIDCDWDAAHGERSPVSRSVPQP